MVGLLQPGPKSPSANSLPTEVRGEGYPHPTILAVHLSLTHTFSKYPQPSIHLLTNLGVEGDAHCGATVRHRYLVRRNPAAPNRAQVHLLDAELLNTLALDPQLQPAITPGEFGENLTTRGLDLCNLPRATRLHLGPSAVIELTSLRTPCRLMNNLRPTLMKASFLPGTRRPRAGVMAVVLASGTVHPGDQVHISLPVQPHTPLQPG